MPSKCRVLVADDNRDAADSLVGLLQAWGHHAHAAYDGEAAYEEFVCFHPDIAILDVQMPRMDGCLAAARMRVHDRPPGLIVSLTGLGHDQEPMKSHGDVFDEHLSKPCDPDELEKLLRRWQEAARVPPGA